MRARPRALPAGGDAAADGDVAVVAPEEVAQRPRRARMVRRTDRATMPEIVERPIPKPRAGPRMPALLALSSEGPRRDHRRP
ncbi:MAG: hypothetical protein WD096_10035 [Actinomycetota bacterium]